MGCHAPADSGRGYRDGPASTSRMISAIDFAGAFAMTIIMTAGMTAMMTTAAHPARELVQIAIPSAAASATTQVNPIDVVVMGKDIAPAFKRDVRIATNRCAGSN